MALNPEEVTNKRFSATKFRQGYDEEEVDEFLDQIVGELRRLHAEIDELRVKLSGCESRVSELSGGAPKPEAPWTKAPSVTDAPQPAPVSAPTPVTVAAVAAPPSGLESATGMLALAQRLHDEHVESGRSKGSKLVSDAQERATSMIREAQETQRSTLGALETQRESLQRKVEELRAFEREYRSRLKAYLQNQLRDLDGAVIEGAVTADDTRTPGLAAAGTPGYDLGVGQPPPGNLASADQRDRAAGDSAGER